MITLELDKNETSEILDIFFHERCRYSTSPDKEAREYCERIDSYINQINKKIKEEQ